MPRCRPTHGETFHTRIMHEGQTRGQSIVWHFQPQTEPGSRWHEVSSFGSVKNVIERCDVNGATVRSFNMSNRHKGSVQRDLLWQRLPRHHIPLPLTLWQRFRHEGWPPLLCAGQGTHPLWPGQERGWRGYSPGAQAEGKREGEETVERMGDRWWKVWPMERDGSLQDFILVQCQMSFWYLPY